jgi:hypothetical protein
VYPTPTSLAAQLVGGLPLGAGFIIGGYCPGTSVVAGATGAKDGFVFVGGFAVGVWVYAFFPGLETWVNQTSIRAVTLPQVFGLSYGAVVAILVVAALATFAGAQWSERKFAYLRPK